MIDLTNIDNIFLITGYTDMRKQVDGLIGVIKNASPEIEISNNVLYIFCNRDKTKIKVIQLDPYGIWVHYKRTNGDKFIWPKAANMIITRKQLLWFLEGLSIEQKTAHKNKKYEY
jgi:transposase